MFLAPSSYGMRVSLTIGLIGVSGQLCARHAVRRARGLITGAGSDDIVQSRGSKSCAPIPHLPLWLALAAILPVTWSPLLIYFRPSTVILGLIDWTGLAQRRALALAVRCARRISALPPN